MDKKNRSPDIDKDEFITVWRRSKDAVEVARKLGITHGSARTIAWRLRKQGIDLTRDK